MASKRPRIEGEPLEVIEPRNVMGKNGWRELRLYAEGFEMEEKRPKKVHVVRWVDIESIRIGRTRATSNGLLIQLRDGVPLTRMERFERAFGGKDLLVPPLFFDSHDELLATFSRYLDRYGSAPQG